MNAEDRLVDWLRRRLGRDQSGDRLGDDAALLDLDRGSWAVSVDQQIEGVHFPTGLDPRTVGRRLMAVCLSDLAATGAEPAYCTLTVALPTGYAARRLLDGVVSACRRYGVELVGGDTASTRGDLVCTATVAGRRPPRGRWLRRGTGRAGDQLWVGGTLGESALGRRLLEAGATPEGRSFRFPRHLRAAEPRMREARRALRRHLLPQPQLDLGLALGRRRRVAALDVSDGLAVDLHRLCRESRVGARIDPAALPRPSGWSEWCRRLDVDGHELLLGGGEDYVLLFALPPAATRPPAGCHRIGELTASPEVRAVRPDGRAESLPERGWDHLSRA